MHIQINNMNNLIDCYMCEEPKVECMITFVEGIPICDTCDIFGASKNFNDECPVCMENGKLWKLGYCSHKFCINCIKTIYFGTSKEKKPHKHWKNIESPNWPFDDNDDDYTIKLEEYWDYEKKYFDLEKNSYEQLLLIRNNSMNDRPEWMNTDLFLEFENNKLLYSIEQYELENIWNKYNDSKIKGNGCCPLCRK